MKKYCVNCLTDESDIDLTSYVQQSSLTNEWLSTDEAAGYLRVSPATLRNMTSNGKIPYYKLDRRNRYRLCDLKKILLSHKRGKTDGIQI